jgi:hypothetical protein
VKRLRIVEYRQGALVRDQSSPQSRHVEDDSGRGMETHVPHLDADRFRAFRLARPCQEKGQREDRRSADHGVATATVVPRSGSSQFEECRALSGGESLD